MTSNPSTSSHPKRQNLNDFHSYWIRDTDPPPVEGQPGQVGPGNCQVCGDVSKKKYYGLEICTGCRAFFQQRKSTRTAIRCLSEFRQQCQLIAKTAKCQYCRFKRCVDVGLDMRHGRFPRIVSGEAMMYVKPFEPMRKDTPAEAMIDSNEVVGSLLELFYRECPYTAVKVNEMVDTFFPYVVDPIYESDINRIEIWKHLSLYLNVDVDRTTNWLPTKPVGNIPDIIAVMKRQLFPMMVVQWTRVCTERHGIRLCDGTNLGYQKMRLAFGAGLAENMVLFANDLRTQQFTDEELMMFSCLLFLQPIAPDDPLRAQLNHPDAFEEHYKIYYRHFMKYLMACQAPLDKLKFGMTQMMPHLNAISELFYNEVRPFLLQNQRHFEWNVFYEMLVECKDTVRPPIPPQRTSIPRNRVFARNSNGHFARQVAQNDQVAQDAQVAHQVAQDAQVAHHVAQDAHVAHHVAQDAHVAQPLEDDDSDIEFIDEVPGIPEGASAPEKPKRKRNKRKSAPEN